MSAKKASYSPNSVTDEFNFKHVSVYVATKARMYSAVDIMKKVGITDTDVANGKFTAAVLEKVIDRNTLLSVRTDIGYASLFNNFQLLPDTSSVTNDIRPDVGIFLNTNEVVCICEEDSTQNESFEESITRACHYSRALCRLKSMGDINQEGVCFVFPSALNKEVKNVKMAVVEVLCNWDYRLCRFSYSATAIQLDGLVEHIKGVIDRECPVDVTVISDAKYLYKFKSDVNMGGYFGHRFNYQYSSARSIVLNVSGDSSQYVMKFVNASTFIMLNRLKKQITNDSVLHFFRHYCQEEGESNLIALMYDVLIPPLTAMEAKMCLRDFIGLLHTTLQSLHGSGFEHCDLRLENICFRHEDSCRIVLIDLDFGACTTTNHWKSRLMSLSDLSCLYRNILNVTSVDYLQLGYMIVWICQYGKTVKMQNGNTFEFASNHHYHTMDALGELAYESDAFVDNLVTKGELFSFVLLI